MFIGLFWLLVCSVEKQSFFDSVHGMTQTELLACLAIVQTPIRCIAMSLEERLGEHSVDVSLVYSCELKTITHGK